MIPRGSRLGRLPDFVIVGAPKAGTTSLAHYLGSHPDIFMATPKEPDFFNDWRDNGRWVRGVSWYRWQFRTGKRVAGEATPLYAAWPVRPSAAERMGRVIPGARLIYVVREPFARLSSHYLMAQRQGRFAGTFDEFVTSPVVPHGDEGALAVACCHYGTQLRHLLRFFPRERILVLELTELAARRAEALATVFRFLGVTPLVDVPAFEDVRNRAEDAVHPNAAGRRLLASLPARMLQTALPRPVFRRLRRRVMARYHEPPHEPRLSPAIEAALAISFRNEVAELRLLSGLALPSLGP
jgi:hypothetical protein